MYRSTGILLFCLCGIRCFSQEQQETPYKNGMSLEFLGLGGFGSVNYEHFFSQKEKRFLAFRVGVGFAPKYLSLADGVNIGLPHGTTINFGRKHYFETGVYGNLLFTPDESQSMVYYVGPMIGYRKQTPKSFSRVFVGYYYITRDDGYFFNIGVAVGFPFRNQDR